MKNKHIKEILVLLLLLVCLSPAFAQQKDVIVERIIQKSTEDLHAIKERHVLRVLVSYSKTNYFVAEGDLRGFEYELFREYEKFLNKGVTKKEHQTVVAFIPVPFEQLIPSLIEGKGDIAAAGLTVTRDRKKKVAFTDPYFSNIDELVVASKDVKGLASLDDLGGRKVYVVRGSSYETHLQKLNQIFTKKGLKPVEIIPAHETLEAEDLMEMVNAGIIDLTVIDSHVAKIWSNAFKDMVVREDLKVNAGGQIAWAVRKDNPKLLANLNQFVAANKKGTLIGNTLFNKYYRDAKWVVINPMETEKRKRLKQYREYFQKYAEMYHFDWLALVAQAFQESRLDQSIRSPSGAIGVMQLLPSTAAYVGIRDISGAEDNIHAGIKYMDYLRANFFNDPEINERVKFDFTLAAYNAGPGRVKQLRDKAEQMGLDRNRWFFNVEYAALEVVGQETVRYVGNINKYYIGLSLSSDTLDAREKKKDVMEKAR